MSTQDATHSDVVTTHIGDMVGSYSATASRNVFGARASKNVIMAVVILGHVAALYAVLCFPSTVMRMIGPEPMQVMLLDEPHHDLPLPLPTPPDMPVTPINIVEPEININIKTEAAPLTVATNVVEASPTTNNVAVPKEVLSVEYLREPAAKYPAAARALKQHGTVILRALIDATGVAREVSVHQSSGFRLLDDAGRTAVLNASFKPYMENGRALPVYVLIPIEFVRPF